MVLKLIYIRYVLNVGGGRGVRAQAFEANQTQNHPRGEFKLVAR